MYKHCNIVCGGKGTFYLCLLHTDRIACMGFKKYKRYIWKKVCCTTYLYIDCFFTHTHTHILVYIPLQIPWITHTIHYILLVMAQCLFLTTIVESWLPIFLSLLRLWYASKEEEREGYFISIPIRYVSYSTKQMPFVKDLQTYRQFD